MHELVGATTPRHHDIYEALGRVIDPELGIAITELGLVYKIGVEGDGVGVVMTLTVPGCPMHATIRGDVEQAVRAVSWVRSVAVEVTFEPPWTPDRMSQEARRQLGR
ncbi:MAG TPA: metal-sulfur cluster assembly factor [Candidatus Dormibacteraeota bacterium]|nr:metal-sulfur cluster assembly factor [Candidatus Dormibacteraeota bacterium]